MKKKILVLIFAFLLLAYAIFTIVRILLTFQLGDFSIYHQSIQLILNTQSPYHNQGFVLNYPPTALLFFFPFGLIPYGLSEKIWTILSLSALLSSIFLLLRLVGKKFNALMFILIFGLAMLSFPLKFNLGMGQVNLFILFFLALCFYSYRMNNKKLAGVFLGIAAAIKLTPLFLLLFFVRKRELNIVGITLLTIFSATILSSFVFDKNLWGEYIFRVLPNIPTVGNNFYYNQALTGFLARADLPVDLARTINYLFLFLLVLISFWVTEVKKRSVLSEMNEYSLFIVSALIGAGLSWQHHFALLVIPFFALFFSLMKISQKYLRLLLPLSILGYMLVSINIKNPQIFNGVATLILSHVLYGAILLYILLIKIVIIVK